jgi:uncharacterized protein
MIRSVSADGIQIGEALYDRTIGLTTDTVFESWSNKSVAELDEDDFCTLLDTNPEVIVLGTGGASIFPPRELVFAMARRRVGFEFMDSAAAARTYNVLAGEGRQVAAVIYL